MYIYFSIYFPLYKKTYNIQYKKKIEKWYMICFTNQQLCWYLSSILRIVHWGGATLWLLRLSNPYMTFNQQQRVKEYDGETTNLSLEPQQEKLNSFCPRARKPFLLILDAIKQYLNHQNLYGMQCFSIDTWKMQHYQHKRTPTGIISYNFHLGEML